MDFASFIGFLAAVITTVSTLPQVIKVIRTRKTNDLSLLMYIVLTLGIGLWFVYGLLIIDYPIIFANGISFGLAFTVLIFKLKYK